MKLLIFYIITRVDLADGAESSLAHELFNEALSHPFFSSSRNKWDKYAFAFIATSDLKTNKLYSGI